MDKNGSWSLAPAYDLCYSYTPGGKWTNHHQLSLNGKQENFIYEDLITVAENMGVRNSKQIVEQITEAVSHWNDYAKEGGVKEEHRRIIDSNLLLLTHRN